MKIPDINKFDRPGEERYSAALDLQKELNSYLQSQFENNKSKDREHLASHIISLVESIVDKLNDVGYKLGRSDYGGDINYEQSEQWYSNGPKIGGGLNIHFLGFTAQVEWDDT